MSRGTSCPPSAPCGSAPLVVGLPAAQSVDRQSERCHRRTRRVPIDRSPGSRSAAGTRSAEQTRGTSLPRRTTFRGCSTQARRRVGREDAPWLSCARTRLLSRLEPVPTARAHVYRPGHGGTGQWECRSVWRGKEVCSSSEKVCTQAGGCRK